MKLTSAYFTDTGIRKTNNQDSLLIQQAQTSRGEIAFVMICDGMGGLKKGEIASACVTQAFRTWFQERMPEICTLKDPLTAILSEWNHLVQHLHLQLKSASEKDGFQWGTTVEALLLMKNHYYICHVGDCRVYQLNDTLEQITKDQSFVQQEIDAGRMTPEEAEQDKRRSLLLQCVGAGKTVQPTILMGEYRINQTFLICCDGLRHKISSSEIESALRSARLGHEKDMRRVLKELTQTCKQRREIDNITGILLHAGNPQNPLRALLPGLYEARHQKITFKLTKDVIVVHTSETLEDMQ